MKKNSRRYEVIDMMGRRWDVTLTAMLAVKIAEKLEREKGLKCQVKEIEREIDAVIKAAN